jgi:outer membrane protein insertion porin family
VESNSLPAPGHGEEQHRARAFVRSACLVWLVLASAAAAQPPAEPPSVAVLPFRVYSAQPIDYLGESLSNLVSARLEAGGRVSVRDADDLSVQLEPADLQQTQESSLRELAERLGVDYVVSGALTELAGRYSLDVRVTPAAVGLDGRTLVLTAERDDELLARVNEVADGVSEHVVGALPARIAEVRIDGAGARADDLVGQLGSRVGEPYDPAVVRSDLALLRADPAIARARVETDREAGGVRLRFQVVLAAAGGRGQAAAGGDLVAEVRVRGNRRIESAAILARVATRPGGRYRSGQIARDVREVNSLGFFRNVRVLTESTPDGLVVTFEVEENPVVRQISISGNENLDGDQIRDILTLTTGSTLDYPLLFENRERVAALYRAQGYYLAEVNYEIERLAEHSVGIHFMVDENEKLKLRQITFKGNEFFSDADLREGFQTKRWRFWSYATSWFDRSGTYSEPLFLQDLQGIQKQYADAGFLQAEVGEPNVIPSPDGLEVAVNIVEGRRFNVGTITIAGDDTVDTESLKEKLLLKEGAIFNRSYLSESVSILTEHYADRGFYFANVSPMSNLADAQQDVDVTFQVHKGPLYFIREIDISGNTVTVDPVVRREVQLVEGQLYSQRQVLLSRLRVERLGFFEEVDISMEPTEVPEQLDLEVQVVERPTGSFSFGAGFSSQDGFVVTGSLAQSNLFGRGYAANASVDFGGQTQRFFLSFTDPYFLGSDFSLGITAFLTSLNFEDFEQEQLGGELILGHALTEDNRTRGFLRYSFARRRLADDTQVTAAAMIFRELFSGTLSTSLVGLSLISDTRNDRLSPNKGWNLGFTLEGAGPLGFAEFARAEARAIWYLGAPRWMPKRSTFVLGTRIGYAIPFNTIGDYDLPAGIPDPIPPVDGNILPLDRIDTDLELPLSERYFLGGLGQFQLRGFRARSVGPRRAILIDEGLNQGFTLTGNYIPVGRVRAFANRDDPDDIWTQPFPPPNDREWVPTTICQAGPGRCNDISDNDVDDFEDLDNTDVIGGNKFISSTFEYRFPISETLGLQGVVFFDTGNAFQEGDFLFDVTEWRYGTGVGVQWFSPFGPLAVVLGFPLDKLSVEDSPVFEFSVGGRDF